MGGFVGMGMGSTVSVIVGSEDGPGVRSFIMLSVGAIETLGLDVIDGADDGMLLKEVPYDKLGIIDGISLDSTLGNEEIDGDKLGIMLSVGAIETLGLDAIDWADDGMFLKEVPYDNLFLIVVTGGSVEVEVGSDGNVEIAFRLFSIGEEEVCIELGSATGSITGAAVVGPWFGSREGTHVGREVGFSVVGILLSRLHMQHSFRHSLLHRPSFSLLPRFALDPFVPIFSSHLFLEVHESKQTLSDVRSHLRSSVSTFSGIVLRVVFASFGSALTFLVVWIVFDLSQKERCCC